MFKSRASIEQNELKWLLDKLKAVKPKVILEIGVHRGYSLEVWENTFKPDTLIGVQDDMSAIDFYDADIIEGDSHANQTLQKVKRALNGQKVDFLFIDGDHTYEGVKSDYEMYGPLVRKGGIIALHDAVITDHPLVKVFEFVEELLEEEVNFETFCDDGTGMGITYVK